MPITLFYSASLNGNTQFFLLCLKSIQNHLSDVKAAGYIHGITHLRFRKNYDLHIMSKHEMIDFKYLVHVNHYI